MHNFWCLVYYWTVGVCVCFVPCHYNASNDFSYLYLRFNLFLKFITICGWQTLYESLGFNNILKCHLVAKMSSQNFNQQGSCETEGCGLKSRSNHTSACISGDRLGSLALVCVQEKNFCYFFVQLCICNPSSDTRIPAGYNLPYIKGHR